MEIEANNSNKNDDNEVLEEIDVYVRIPKKELYMLHYPLRPYEAGISKYETIEGIRGKPLQNKLDIDVKVSNECENYAQAQNEVRYELTSKNINNRTNYCVGKIEKNSLILIPVNHCLQMRKSFADLDEKFKDPKKVKKEKAEADEKRDSEIQDVAAQLKRGENVKQIERKMRTYNFQKKLLDSEQEIPLRFSKKESHDSRRLVQSLLDPPTEVKELKTLDKNEYLKYLF